MPSTRKQKANEKRSRQSDMMSDLKNMDVILGNYPRNEYVGHQNENDADRESHGGKQNVNPIGEDFRSLSNTNSRENCEIIVETAGMIKCEIIKEA